MNGTTGPFWGHSKNKLGRCETVMQHMQRVATLSEAFASAWGGAWEGRAAGMLHDLGKYGELFQGVLRHEEQKIDHSTAGAAAVLQHYGGGGLAIAAAIQGHHGGLQCLNVRTLVDALRMTTAGANGRRYSSTELPRLIERYQADGGFWPVAGVSRLAQHLKPLIPVAAMLDARMLFSALVDADYLATAGHFEEGSEGYRVRESGLDFDPERALNELTEYVEQLSRRSKASADMRALRTDLLMACLDAAALPPGLFTLTAPTGAGKTLAMMAFALRHAAEHDMRRVVVVLPYLNIIEQSAQTYERVFANMPAGYVLQDHSLVPEPAGHEEDEADPLRLAAQNWDAPVIVTTTVRFFESLFANRPTDCRKLHRLARSVVMFDETQTMPVSLVLPTLAALSHLQSNYGATVLFSTATQPAFTDVYDRAQAKTVYSVEGWRPREIAAPNLRLFQRARRVTVEWPQGELAWEELASRLAATPQTLAIVNLRRHARQLYDLVYCQAADGTFHLSTNMCPKHRLDVLAEVHQRLHEGLPCRLISTQCVEAGVDIDFPDVWRALAGLDAIAQAAGRCNREGSRDLGTVHVFLSPREGRLYPSDEYEHAALTLRQMLRERQDALDLQDTALVQDFFRRYYAFDRPEDKIKPGLKQAIEALNLEQTAQEYHWIDTQGANVLAPYAPQAELFDKLGKQVREEGLTTGWVRAARPLTVSVRGRLALHDVTEEVVDRKGEPTGWRILLQRQAYDSKTGLNISEEIRPERYIA